MFSYLKALLLVVVMIFFVRMFAPIKGLFYLSQNVPNIFVKWYNYI